MYKLRGANPTVKIKPIHVGPNSPVHSELIEGVIWIDTSSNNFTVKVWTGNQWINLVVDIAFLDAYFTLADLIQKLEKDSEDYQLFKIAVRNIFERTNFNEQNLEELFRSHFSAYFTLANLIQRLRANIEDYEAFKITTQNNFQNLNNLRDINNLEHAIINQRIENLKENNDAQHSIMNQRLRNLEENVISLATSYYNLANIVLTNLDNLYRRL